MRDLPPELVERVIKYLSDKDRGYLLCHAPNRQWFYAVVTLEYRSFTFKDGKEVLWLHDLLHINELKRKRSELDDSSASPIYKSFKYATFIRNLDFSLAWKSITRYATLEGPITRLVMKCTHLRSLDLYQRFDVTNSDLKSILEHCPQLERLSLVGCTELNTTFLFSWTGGRKKSLVPVARSLRYLNVDRIPMFFMTVPAIRRKHPPLLLPALESLVLGHRSDMGVDEIAMAARFFKQCPNLVSLKGYNTDGRFIADILLTAKKITSVVLFGVLNNQLETMEALAHVGPLRQFEFRGTRHFDGDFGSENADDFSAFVDRPRDINKHNIGALFSKLQFQCPTRVEALFPVNIVHALQRRNALGPWLTSFRTACTLSNADLQTLATQCPQMIEFHLHYKAKNPVPSALFDTLEAWKSTLTHLTLTHIEKTSWILAQFEQRPQLSRNIVFFNDPTLVADINTIPQVHRAFPALQYLGVAHLSMLDWRDYSERIDQVDLVGEWHTFFAALKTLGLRGFYSGDLARLEGNPADWDIPGNDIDRREYQDIEDHLITPFRDYFYKTKE
ncbi:hypothetical protein BC940DRAFT_308891 [Gongronella butleri]|nr:hypothetical protein BC940DRAFT_308891 [Gongronella butleri]